mmetsp:Transcript_5025/g.9977  ORF Transcript_5025/g.9977 Transcript_5025/m.9977 type:complete len:206 (+) Transcript_5025:1139-1756(+)
MDSINFGAMSKELALLSQEIRAEVHGDHIPSMTSKKSPIFCPKRFPFHSPRNVSLLLEGAFLLFGELTHHETTRPSRCGVRLTDHRLHLPLSVEHSFKRTTFMGWHYCTRISGLLGGRRLHSREVHSWISEACVGYPDCIRMHIRAAIAIFFTRATSQLESMHLAARRCSRWAPAVYNQGRLPICDRYIRNRKWRDGHLVLLCTH